MSQSGGKSIVAETGSLEEGAAHTLAILQFEIAELEKSIFHLHRSNEELRQALKEAPGDEDFQSAISGNTHVLAKKLALLTERKALLAEMCGAEVLKVAGEKLEGANGDTKKEDEADGVFL